MFKEDIKIYSSQIGSDDLKPYENQDVINLLTKTVPVFQAAYIPEMYDVAFVLVKENHYDSYSDEWRIIFFKKVIKMPELSSGTITLDNIGDMKSTGSAYEIYKEFNGSFEDVIKVSCDLITKHRFGYEKELESSE